MGCLFGVVCVCMLTVSNDLLMSSAVVVVVCHDQVRLQVSQGFRCRDS